MKCCHCQGEMSADAAQCPRCERPVEAALAAAAVGPPGAVTSARGPAEAVEVGPGLGVNPSAGGRQSDAHSNNVNDTNVNDTQSRRGGWSPSKERVEGWAVGHRLSHYEVLELGADAGAEAIQERARLLERRLDRWAGDPTDAGLQKLGSAGMNRLFELRQDFGSEAARAAYDARLREERHTASLRRVIELAGRCVERDRALQWNEWKFTLLPAAEEEGVGREELEAALRELREGGVITGLALDGHEVRTILELKDACQGHGELLIEPLLDGRLEQWLERCAARKDLAAEARLVREQLPADSLASAHGLLWRMGERRLVLAAGKDREVCVMGLAEWVEGVYGGDLEGATAQALRDGRLGAWFSVALSQERLARVAAAEKAGGRRGLWRLVWETGERIKAHEKAYEKTKVLVQEYPNFWEAHYQHAVHCALTKRTAEMGTHLRRAVKGDNAYATRALNDPDLREHRKEVLPLVKEAVPISSFKFKQGEAFSVADLVDLCDAAPDEAKDYLYNGYLERWLAEKQGEGALAAQTRTIISKVQRTDQRKGLELFVRELCRAAGRDPLPKLSAEPARIRLGGLAVGRCASVKIELRNAGRGLAWGTVKLDPQLPGVSLSASSFDHAGNSFELRLDTLRVAPGPHRGKVVISADGVPDPVEVPVEFEVLPLRVTVQPAEIKLGKLMHGTRHSVAITVACAPEGGRLEGSRKKFQPPVAGLAVSGELSGASGTLEVVVDTAKLKTGTKYKTEFVIVSNVGPIKVPVEFKTSLLWKWIVFWRTLAFSLGAGAALFAARQLMSGVEGLEGWFLSYDASVGVVLATGAFGAVASAAILLAFRETQLVGRLLHNKYLSRAAASRVLGTFRAEETIIMLKPDESAGAKPKKGN